MIIKRDGRLVEFDKDKIKAAILKAFKEVDGEVTPYAEEKADTISTYIEEKVGDEDIGIEAIQDLVENGLMATKRKDVARAYILYRQKRSQVRSYKTDLMRTIKEKLRAANVQNNNANLDEHSFGGRRGEATSELLRSIALDELVSPMARENHLNNEIYIHDLDHYVLGDHNCLSVPFDKLLAEGFNTRQIDVRPANSVNTAFQLVAVIFQLQSLMQFGGVSATHLDWTMVPYVRKSFYKHWQDGVYFVDNDFAGFEASPETPIVDYPEGAARDYAMTMTKREIHQAVEGMYHNLNTLQSRSGNQLPFSSINYGTCTLPEGRMVIEELLNVSIEGLGRLHRTSIFPCGIFQIGEGINKHPGNPNYDLFRLALKSTSLRLYPNYANIDWTVNAGYDKNDPKTYFSTMGKQSYSSCKIFLTSLEGVA